MSGKQIPISLRVETAYAVPNTVGSHNEVARVRIGFSKNPTTKEITPYLTRFEAYTLHTPEGTKQLRKVLTQASDASELFERNPRIVAGALSKGLVDFSTVSSEEGTDAQVYAGIGEEINSYITEQQKKGITVRLYRQNRIYISHQEEKIRVVGTSASLSKKPFFWPVALELMV